MWIFINIKNKYYVAALVYVQQLLKNIKKKIMQNNVCNYILLCSIFIELVFINVNYSVLKFRYRKNDASF